MDFIPLFWDNYCMGTETKKPDIVDLFSMTRTELEEAYIKLYTKCAEAEAKLERFLQEIRRSRARHYGTSSEKNITGQMTIFDLPGMKEENPQVSAQSPEEEEAIRELVEEATGKSKKARSRKGKIEKKDLSALEVETIEFKLSPEEQFCSACGGKLELVKKIVRKELCVEAPRVHVKEYVSEQYVCRNCAANDKPALFIVPGTPKPLFYNSPVSPSFVADSIHKKYAMALPFDRQAKEYKRQKLPVTKDNLCKWSIWLQKGSFRRS